MRGICCSRALDQSKSPKMNGIWNRHVQGWSCMAAICKQKDCREISWRMLTQWNIQSSDITEPRNLSSIGQYNSEPMGLRDQGCLLFAELQRNLLYRDHLIIFLIDIFMLVSIACGQSKTKLVREAETKANACQQVARAVVSSLIGWEVWKTNRKMTQINK